MWTTEVAGQSRRRKGGREGGRRERERGVVNISTTTVGQGRIGEEREPLGGDGKSVCVCVCGGLGGGMVH